MVVESRSVIRKAKNVRGLGREPPPFPSRARLILALFVLYVPTILSESLAQASNKVVIELLV